MSDDLNDDTRSRLRDAEKATNSNTVLLAQMLGDIGSLKVERDERKSLMRTVRNAVIVAILGALLGAASIIEAVKGLFRGGFEMTEQGKATIKLWLGVTLQILNGALAAVSAAGDTLDVFRTRPTVWLNIAIAGVIGIMQALSKSPAQGAAIDDAIEAKADMKAEAKLQDLMDTGKIRIP